MAIAQACRAKFPPPPPRPPTPEERSKAKAAYEKCLYDNAEQDRKFDPAIQAAENKLQAKREEYQQLREQDQQGLRQDQPVNPNKFALTTSIEIDIFRLERELSDLNMKKSFAGRYCPPPPE
ncbi:MAG: hypothetical protein WAV07_03520 [Candidatus Contendobacter sp.]